jgi:hypothetical protein
MEVPEPNCIYLISSYGEPPIEALFLKEERGFYVFEHQNIKLPIRKQYVKILKEIKNESN